MAVHLGDNTTHQIIGQGDVYKIYWMPTKLKNMLLGSKRIYSLQKQFDQISKEIIIESGNYILRNSKGLRIVKCIFPQCSDDKHHFGVHSKDLGLLPCREAQ
jgi:hypothetical protein